MAKKTEEVKVETANVSTEGTQEGNMQQGAEQTQEGANTETSQEDNAPAGDTEEKTSENKSPKPTPEAKVAGSSKKVKIRTTEDINCMISCTPYQIKKDKEVQVPSDVAAILVNAKKAYRI